MVQRRSDEGGSLTRANTRQGARAGHAVLAILPPIRGISIFSALRRLIRALVWTSMVHATAWWSDQQTATSVPEAGILKTKGLAHG